MKALFFFIVIVLSVSCNSVQEKNAENTVIIDISADTVVPFDTTQSVTKNEIEAVIPTVTIGKQVWMQNNLSVQTYRNGDSIPVFTNIDQWKKFSKSKKGVSAVYNNNKNSEKKYGRLYNWYAVSDPRGLCPIGFKVPNENDFIELLVFVGGKNYNTEVALEALSVGGSSGFEAIFGGWCCMDTELDGEFFDFVNSNINGSYWSITPSEDEHDCAINLDLGSTWRSDSYGAYLSSYSTKSLAFSVRCIKE